MFDFRKDMLRIQKEKLLYCYELSMFTQVQGPSSLVSHFDMYINYELSMFTKLGIKYQNPAHPYNHVVINDYIWLYLLWRIV